MLGVLICISLPSMLFPLKAIFIAVLLSEPWEQVERYGCAWGTQSSFLRALLPLSNEKHCTVVKMIQFYIFKSLWDFFSLIYTIKNKF